MKNKKLAITKKDIIEDGFLDAEEIDECLIWMQRIVTEKPEYNNKEKLLELLEIFKEMSFQSS